MRMEITSRIAALLLVAIFLSNDVLASVHALSHGIPEVKNVNDVEATWFHPTPIPAPTRTKKSPRVDVMASQQVAHLNDGANRSEDDIFNVELDLEQGDFQYAYLSYEVKGVANAEDLPKALNNQRTYGSDALRPSNNEEWKSTRIRIALDDIQQGSNTIRFSVPEGFHYPVQVKNVSLSLMESLEEREPVQRSFERKLASTIDFQVMDSASSLQGYVASRAEIASIPNHIVNITRNAPAYQLEGDGFTGYHVAIGVDASMLKTQSDLNQAQVFFFDRISRSWKTAHTVKVDRELLRIEAMVPGETDYFAGLIKSPDMPEASAYVPTNISDIEPANPATGMRLMQAPQINRSGSASINYPLWIPQGRNGMTPPVSVSYNSDAGTGWMGMGWNIGSSSISVDTKWGVPRYDTDEETEGYVLDGEALFQEGGFRPNKAVLNGNGEVVPNFRDKTPMANTRFFPRVMNSYVTIERLGGSPSTYAWKVTDASKTVRYFGTTDGNGVDDNAVLREGTSGVIAKWFLRRVVDQWGNSIDYEYERTSNSDAKTMTNGGKGVYLSKIHYTGHNGTLGKYRVEFERNDNPRRDGSVMMNYGFKVIDDQRLDEIKVYYENDLLVSYVFGYSNEEDTQFKTLLDYIAEHRGGSEFYRHTMTYYGGGLEFESTPDVINIGQGTSHLRDAPWYVNSIVNPLYRSIKPSPIQTSISEGDNGSGSMGVGLAEEFMGLTFDKTGAVNIGMSGSRSNTDAIRRMQDFNGDGIPDMVSDRGDRVYYYPITRDDNGTLSIGSRQRVHIDGFERTRTSSIGAKVEVVGLKSSGVQQVGLNWSRSRSEGLRSLTDYNADGFPDLLQRDGSTVKVLFGEIDENGEYRFKGSSESTYNPVIKGEEVVPPPTDDDYTKPMEIVRVWKAFADGQILISGDASIVSGQTGSVDVAIQHNTSFVENFQTVTPTSAKTFSTNVNVVKGDLILFRTRSGSDGQGDLLDWNPTVSYTGQSYTDGHGADWGTSSADDGLVFSDEKGISFKADREFKINMNYLNHVNLSDHSLIHVELLVNGVLAQRYSELLFQGTPGSPSFASVPFIDADGTGSFVDANTLPGVNSDNDIVTFRFRLWNTTNIDWSAVEWLPTIEFGPNCSDPINTHYAFPALESYNEMDVYGSDKDLGTVSPGNTYQLLPDITEVDADILDALSGGGYPQKSVVNMTLKSGGVTAQRLAVEFFTDGATNTYVRLVNLKLGAGSAPDYQGSTVLNLSTLTSAPGGVTFTSADVANENKVEFFVDGPFAEALSDYIQNHLQGFVLLDQNGVVRTLNNEDVSIYRRASNELQMHYKHWGLFAWSPLSGEENFAIDPADLHFPLNGLASTDPANFDFNQIENNPDLYNAEEFEFWQLQALRGEYSTGLWTNQKTELAATRDRDRYALMGHPLAAFRAQGTVSPMILGELDLSVSEPAIAVGSYDPSYTAFGALSQGRSHTLSVNTGLDNVSASVSFSDPLVFFSKQKTVFADMNGDGYPDILTDDDGIQGQFTNPLGGFGNQQSVSNVDRLNKGTSIGGSASWSGAYSNEGKKYRVSGPISGSMSHSKPRTSTFDINGDGLPDAYSDGISANEFRLGYGNGFESNEFDAFGTIKNQSFSVSVTGPLSIYNSPLSKYVRSISTGLNINFVGNYSDELYHDFNGDGLMDYLDLTLTDELWLNTGTGFVQYNLSSNDIVPINENINKSGSTGVSAQASFTLGPIIASLKAPVNASYGDNFSINRVKTSFMDMNGDGAPDYVHAENGNLKIYYAKFGKANKLKEVTNPLGGTFTVDYEVVGNKRGYFDPVIPTHLSELENEKMLWDMPNGKWVMSQLTVADNLDLNDGTTDLDGVDEMTLKFAYDGGIRLRREKEFVGFTRIATIQPDQLDKLEDYCDASSDFEVDNPRDTEGWYNLPLKPDDSYSYTKVKRTSRYNMSVQDYVKPSSLDPIAQMKFLYERNIQLHNYSLHVHEWRDSVKVMSCTGPNGQEPCVFVRYDKWTHQHVELISDQGVDYELRIVETGVGEASETPLGQVILEEPGDWLLVEDRYGDNDIPEVLTVFPATTDKRNINYPIVEDRQNVNLQKYHVKYDSYFNVVWYEDYGDLVVPILDTVPIDTIYTGHYEYYTQSNPCSTLGDANHEIVDDPDGRHYFVHVVCEDTSFEPDTIWGIQSTTTACGFEAGVGPRTICENDGPSYTSVHRKWVIEETIFYHVIDISDYDHRIIATMDYFEPTSANGRTNALEEHKIYSDNTSTNANLRRHAKVLSLFQGKAPSQMANYVDNTGSTSQAQITDIAYNATYGNVTSVTGPGATPADRATTTFSYDTEVHQFVMRTDNAYDEFTCNLYDFGHQQLLQTTDVNGQKMRYAYDENQRLEAVWAPREMAAPSFGPTVSFDYDPFHKVATRKMPRAYTYHNTSNKNLLIHYAPDSENCDALVDVSGWTRVMSSSVPTVTFTDLQARVVQIQTLSDWDDPSSTSDHTMSDKLRVSGASVINEFGLVVKTYNDFLEDPAKLGELQEYESDEISRTEYDYLSRPVRMESAWSNLSTQVNTFSVTTQERYWGTWNGKPRLVERTTADSKSISQTYVDHKGRQIATVAQGGTWAAAAEETSFEYDDLGQLSKVINPVGQETTYGYDFLGRTIQEVHSDRGTTDMVYDLGGNLIELHTEGTGTGFIAFEYDKHRLIGKTMPVGSTNAALYDVEYEYGARGDFRNGAGRVIRVTQGNTATPTLLENLYYDELGQTQRQVRRIHIPNQGVHEYDTRFYYDSFGRQLRIQYPDEEKVDYRYSALGSLTRVDVTKATCTNVPKLIDEISYDGFDNMVYMKYGNGTENTFDYHSVTRGLMNSAVQATLKDYAYTEVMNRDYKYNRLGMLAESSVTPHRSFLSSSVRIVSDFRYDGLLRLKTTDMEVFPESYSVLEEPNPSPVTISYAQSDMYSVSMEYGTGGRIMDKTSTRLNSNHLVDPALTYDLEVEYQDQKKHQIKKVTDGANISTFTYNTSGSITSITTGTNSELMLWNEEQQMVAAKNDNGIHHYIYDYNGERIMKSSFTQASVLLNDVYEQSDNQTGSGTLDAYKVYVNPYVVKEYYSNDDKTTHHYYMGMQRVASGRFTQDNSSTGSAKTDHGAEEAESTNELNAVQEQLLNIFEEFGMVEGEDYTREDITRTVRMEEVYPEYVSNKMNEDGGPMTGAGLESENSTVESYCEGILTEVYWYHPNYIGSVDLVTDVSGQVHQFFLYTPWGESMYTHNAQSQGFDSPYRFNGKELDQETGLGYYGARYYQNKLSIWLSVDPLAMYEDNVTRSPYNFTDNNPVMLVDPDGRNAWKPDGNGGWIAEAGDGAETLARDAGISKEEAYMLMEQQGFGTYEEGGVLKSAVDPGDVVVVPIHKKRSELRQEQKAVIQEQIELQEALIEVYNAIAVILWDERESLTNQVEMSTQSDQNSPDADDPKGGLGVGTGVVNTAKELRIQELSRQLRAVLREIEQLNASNEELEKELE